MPCHSRIVMVKNVVPTGKLIIYSFDDKHFYTYVRI